MGGRSEVEEGRSEWKAGNEGNLAREGFYRKSKNPGGYDLPGFRKLFPSATGKALPAFPSGEG
jgi:hypothetical protein